MTGVTGVTGVNDVAESVDSADSVVGGPGTGAPSAAPAFAHVSVMADEVLEWLEPVPPGLVIDATVGGAGHARRILDRYPQLSLLGLDRDPLAVGVARERLAPYGERAAVVHARYDDLPAVLRTRYPEAPPVVSAVLFDLGVSSAQFDIGERGFSYRVDAALDMRMDTTAGITAADVVNTYGERELAGVLRTYGDERFAGRIAKAIIAARPVLSTVALSELVVNAIPAATRRTGGHPAKRTFQALRIEVNDELRVLERALDAAIDALAPGGRCIVLAYHSGEDRIVKDRLRFAETDGCSCPPGLPCVCGALPRGRAVRRGVIRPQAAEVAANPRAASAVARVFERTVPAPGAGTVGSPEPRAASPAGSQTVRTRKVRP